MIRSALRRSVAVLVGLLLLSACTDAAGPAPSSTTSATSAKGKVVVGGADFTEMLIVQELYAALLRQAGYQVTISPSRDRTVYLPALERGELTVVPDYAATLKTYLATHPPSVTASGTPDATASDSPDATASDSPDATASNTPDATASDSPDATASNTPDATASTVPDASAASNLDATMTALQALAKARGLRALEPAKAANGTGFYVSGQFATDNDIATLTELGALKKPVTVAAGTDCLTAPLCAPALTASYAITVAGVTGDGVGSLTGKQKVVAGTAQVGVTGTTDPDIVGLGLVLLGDDKRTQLPENLVPVVSSDAPAGVASALQPLAATLTTADLAALNAEVANGTTPTEAARVYLGKKGMLKN